MSEKLLRIRGLDTLLFRDGRPFSNEPGAFIARTLRAPLPGTVAGFLRTRIGKRKGWDWGGNGPADALKIAVDGPILLLNGQPVFHAPADALIHKDENDRDKEKVMCLRPMSLTDGGTNIPDSMRPLQVLKDVKPEPDYNFWKWEDMKRWLLHPAGWGFPLPQKIAGFPLEERVHVEISPVGTSEESKLFSAQFLGFEQHRWEGFTRKGKEEWSIIAKVESDLDNLNGVGQLGGENRSAVVVKASEQDWPVCPDDLKKELSASKYVRMFLATPAIFRNGWKPGWLDGDSSGPVLKSLAHKLKLVGAAVKRREPVSGWDYKWKHPKPVRWMVPGGSVYFFEVQDSTNFPVDQLWMKSVSDDPQDQRDGYGLALWGIWKENNQGDKS